MGYVMVFGNCILCGRVFSFNPRTVPSTSKFTGKREPVCKDCMDALIAKEEAAGIKPKRYAPDAYDPLPEEEL